MQEEAVEAPEEPIVQSGYSVQVGAFADVRNAEALVARLRDGGYDAVRVEVEKKEDSVFHCVRVGLLTDRTDAVSLAAVLEEKESLSTRIVRTTIRSPRSQTEGQ